VVRVVVEKFVVAISLALAWEQMPRGSYRSAKMIAKINAGFSFDRSPLAPAE